MRMTLRNTVVVAVLFSLSGALSPVALGQTNQIQGAQQGDDIVVTRQLDPPTLGAEIRRFVRGHARLTRIDQIGRWHSPICVRVTNLPAAYGDFIANRIVTIAREAGAPTQDQAGCAPNVSIIFTTEPQALLDSIRAERPELLGFHRIGQRDAVATMSRPIQAWHVTATSNGMVTAIDEPMSDPPAGAAGSRLTHRLQSLFVHVLIIVNQNEVTDAQIGPISDYLAMMALTDIRDGTWQCGGLITILELFSAECSASAPQELTTPDRAFLQGLYTMDAQAVASLQRAGISREMRDVLTDDEPQSD